VRVTAVQFELRAESSFDEFSRHVERVVREAVEERADVVVLPGLVTTGLLATRGSVSTAEIHDAYRTLLPTFTDPLIELYVRLAKSYEVAVAGGSHYRVDDDSVLRNTAYLVKPNGSVLSQDKLHLTPLELALGATGGDDVMVTRLAEFTVALQICADIEFPEISRHLVSEGVDLMFCPSLTWNRRGAERVRTGARARAMENQFYVVGAPMIGTSGLPADHPIHCTGTAFVTAPIDRTLGYNDGFVMILDEAGRRRPPPIWTGIYCWPHAHARRFLGWHSVERIFTRDSVFPRRWEHDLRPRASSPLPRDGRARVSLQQSLSGDRRRRDGRVLPEPRVELPRTPRAGARSLGRGCQSRVPGTGAPRSGRRGEGRVPSSRTEQFRPRMELVRDREPIANVVLSYVNVDVAMPSPASRPLPEAIAYALSNEGEPQ